VSANDLEFLGCNTALDYDEETEFPVVVSEDFFCDDEIKETDLPIVDSKRIRFCKVRKADKKHSIGDYNTSKRIFNCFPY
jgi:hypothetical protein